MKLLNTARDAFQRIKRKQVKSRKSLSHGLFVICLVLSLIGGVIKLRIMCMPYAQGVPAIGIAILEVIVVASSVVLWSAREISGVQCTMIVCIETVSWFLFISKLLC